MKGAGAGFGGERMLTFEVGASLYALPIACVREVCEVEPLSCVPTLPASVAGVVNHHGDALPVLRRSVLLGVDEAGLPEPAHVLVVTAKPNGRARLGLPVDRIEGLVDAEAPTAATGTAVVSERRSIDGRIVSVLDPMLIVERARSVIEGAVAVE